MRLTEVLLLLFLAVGCVRGGDPVSVWHFDEGVGAETWDETGKHKAVLTHFPKAVEWTAGKSGSGLHVTGRTSQRSSSGGVAFRFPEGTFVRPFSLELWFRLDPGISAGETREIINGGYEKTSGFRVYYYARKLFVYTGNGGRHHVYRSGQVVDSVPENLWHFLAVSYDGSRFSLYLNGELVSCSEMKLEYNRLFTLGSYHGYVYPLIGVLDEFRLYDHARSRDEILQSYLDGAL